MHELPKGEDMLCYKQGSNYINLGIELCLDYKDDREKRNNNALKIYSDWEIKWSKQSLISSYQY